MEKSARSLLILGTRTFAVEVSDLVSDIDSLKVSAFVENMDPKLCQQQLEGLPILWVDKLAELADSHYAICGLSTTFRSRFTEQAADFGIKFATVVHPSAQISSTSSAGEGSIISRGVIIASHTRLGQHVIVNRGALIGHHTRVGDYVSIQPGANIAGACDIGDASYIGMGAVVIDHVKVGSHSVIGAGTVVTKDVPENVLVVGVPAKVVKENIPGK